MYYKMFPQDTDDAEINTENDQITEDFTSFLTTWGLDRAIEIDGQFYPREYFKQAETETDEVVEAEVEEEVQEAKVIQLHDKQ